MTQPANAASGWTETPMTTSGRGRRNRPATTARKLNVTMFSTRCQSFRV